MAHDRAEGAEESVRPGIRYALETTVRLLQYITNENLMVCGHVDCDCHLEERWEAYELIVIIKQLLKEDRS
jgi:hypothetical protein